MLPLLKHNFSTNLPISDPYLYKLALPGVFEGGEEVSVLLDGVVGVEHVDAEVTQRRPEIVQLCGVLEQQHKIRLLLCRVTHHVVLKVELTSKHKFHFSKKGLY